MSYGTTFKIWSYAVAYPGILFLGGQQIQDRENGDLGAVAP